MLWKLSLKILTPYCQTCKKEDLLWETSTTHSQLPYSKIQSRYLTLAQPHVNIEMTFLVNSNLTFLGAR